MDIKHQSKIFILIKFHCGIVPHKACMQYVVHTTQKCNKISNMVCWFPSITKTTEWNNYPFDIHIQKAHFNSEFLSQFILTIYTPAQITFTVLMLTDNCDEINLQ